MKRAAVVFCMAFVLAACERAADDAERESALAVTTAEVALGDVEVKQYSVGRIEATIAPRVAAEVAGRVVEVHKDAGDAVHEGITLARIEDDDYRNALERAEAALERAEALHIQHARTVERYRRLVEEESAAQNLLDDAEAQLASTAAQRREAHAQVADARKALERTRITSTVDGDVQARLVSAGDFVAVGEPLFVLATAARLRVVLPFPERVLDELEPGQEVTLTRPTGTREVRTTITELRPMVGEASRAIEAIVELDNPGGWRPGGTVAATVVTARRTGQPLVPAQAVVQRPAGFVVYVVEADRARQRPVEPGVSMNGRVEILEGVGAGERIVVDGAGFLTDGARIEVRD